MACHIFWGVLPLKKKTQKPKTKHPFASSNRKHLFSATGKTWKATLSFQNTHRNVKKSINISIFPPSACQEASSDETFFFFPNHAPRSTSSIQRHSKGHSSLCQGHRRHHCNGLSHIFLPLKKQKKTKHPSKLFSTRKHLFSATGVTWKAILFFSEQRQKCTEINQLTSPFSQRQHARKRIVMKTFFLPFYSEAPQDFKGIQRDRRHSIQEMHLSRI